MTAQSDSPPTTSDGSDGPDGSDGSGSSTEQPHCLVEQ